MCVCVCVWYDPVNGKHIQTLFTISQPPNPLQPRGPQCSNGTTDICDLSVSVLCVSVLVAMKTLCLHSARYGTVSSSLSEGKALLESDLKEDQPIDDVLGAHIKALWQDPAIQETYHHQSEFQLSDSAAYFFDKVKSTHITREWCTTSRRSWLSG